MPIRYRKDPVYCEYCGKLIEHAIGNRKYHPECAKVATREKERKRKQETNKIVQTLKKEAEERKARKGPSLEEIMHAANKEGLQYADYCKKHNMY